jgi:hypothetical protein
MLTKLQYKALLILLITIGINNFCSIVHADVDQLEPEQVEQQNVVVGIDGSIELSPSIEEMTEQKEVEELDSTEEVEVKSETLDFESDIQADGYENDGEASQEPEKMDHVTEEHIETIQSEKNSAAISEHEQDTHNYQEEILDSEAPESNIEEVADESERELNENQQNQAESTTVLSSDSVVTSNGNEAPESNIEEVAAESERELNENQQSQAESTTVFSSDSVVTSNEDVVDPNCPHRSHIIKCAGKYLDEDLDGKLSRSELDTAIGRLPW